MGIPLLLAVSVVYVAVGVAYLAEHRLGMGLAFLAYAIANVGFAMDLWRP